MKVVIVAKTRKGGGACIGGLTFDGRSVRLVHPNEGTIDQFNMEYQIGDVWEIEGVDDPATPPPHVENIVVTTQRKLPAIDQLAEFAIRQMPPRSGGLEMLFDGLTGATSRGALYIAERLGLPAYSTMLWRPDQTLVRDDDATRIRYRYPTEDGGRTLTFVGFQDPPPELPAGTLLRVSLAHWWCPDDRPDGELRCYVQLSGWFVEDEPDYAPDYLPEVVETTAEWTDYMPPVPALPVLSDDVAAKETLKEIFGYDNFREPQADIIRNIADKRDTLAVMPTGSGKSLCYQLPALHFPGLTVVVSPLISLMEDQVMQLRELGIPAAFLNSTLSYEEYLRVQQQVRNGRIKLLYAAPETLLRPETLLLLEQSQVDCLTIDEAHCISEWGHDFRPEYRQLVELRRRLPQAVCLAVTATATDRVRDDIKQTLNIHDADEFVSSFDRKNLVLAVDDRFDGLNQTIAFLKAHPDEAGIIYCTTRKRVDEMSDALARRGYRVLPYHAGLDEATRRQNQHRFSREEGQIVVATIAFGMGINKSNVRFILHHDLPSNLESYYQQIGRAGRDGLPADCLLLLDKRDANTVLFFINNQDESQRAGAHARLQAMLAYAETTTCRRRPLLGYFGETYEADNCGQCDNCLREDVDLVDLTIAAQKFLSCVVRTKELFGASHIIDVLRGSQAKRVVDKGHHRLSTYNIGQELSKRQWQHLARQFVRRGLLVQDMEYGSLKMTEAGWAVLRGETFQGEQPPTEHIYARAEAAEGYDRALFSLLREKRTELAQEQDVPPYVIFSDRALAGMATTYPLTPAEFTAINGIGRHKLETYGDTFMAIVRTYVEDNDIERPAPVSRTGNGRRQTYRPNGGTPTTSRPARRAGTRTEQVMDALRAGQSLDTLAKEFGVVSSTIINHLWMAVQSGDSFDAALVPLPEALSSSELERIYGLFDKHGFDRFVTTYEALNEAYSYDTLKMAAIRYVLEQPEKAVSRTDQEEAAEVILEALDLLPGELPRSGLAKLLLGNATGRAADFQDHPAFGSLSQMNYYLVMRMIDKLLSDGAIDQIDQRLYPGA